MIAPMKKVSIVCMKDDREKVLSALQHSALMMITASENGVPGSDKESSEKQRRVDQLLRELAKYEKKKGMFDQPKAVSKDDFDHISEDTVKLCGEIEAFVEKRDLSAAEITSLNNTLELLSEWKELKTDLGNITGTDNTETVIGKLPVLKFDEFRSRIENTDADFEKVSENEKTVQILLVYFKDTSSEIRQLLTDCEFEEVRIPFESGTVTDIIDKTTNKLDNVKKEYDENVEKLKEITDKSKTDVETLFEQYRASTDRTEVRLNETAETVFIEGWVRADSVDKLTKVVNKATNVFDIETRDPEDDEEVPTSLTNSKVVTQFEGITEMFNPPKYGDFDPNTVMAPWYWIIFGMMMGDAGYGLMMVLMILAGKKLLRPQGGMAKLMNVILYSSITTIIFGILFGSYFGEELLPAVLPFTAMGDPIKMLILTIVIGVLHIFTGMITKMVLDIRNGHPWDAVFDQLSWMMIIAGVGMIFLPALQKVGMIVAIAGALIILFTAGRHKKGIIGKLVGGLGGLYNITSYFSDILSYSRILALSLATGVVGMVMNLLAGMVQGSIIGFILSLLIYVVGHVFNLVLGLLSAYVHACRLQYIEFYGKFYEGGGTIFKPFGIKTNYINIKKD